MKKIRKSLPFGVGSICRAQAAAGKCLSRVALSSEIRAALGVIAGAPKRPIRVRRAAAQKVIALMKLELCGQNGTGDGEALLRYSLQDTWAVLSQQGLVTGSLVEGRFAQGEREQVAKLIASLYRTPNGTGQSPVNPTPPLSATCSVRCFSNSMDELRGLMGGARERRLATRDLDEILTSR